MSFTNEYLKGNEWSDWGDDFFFKSETSFAVGDKVKLDDCDAILGQYRGVCGIITAVDYQLRLVSVVTENGDVAGYIPVKHIKHHETCQ